MANLKIEVNALNLDVVKDIIEGIQYELQAVEYELDKACETIELMNDERLSLNKEILSLQEQVHYHEMKTHGNAKLSLLEAVTIKNLLNSGKSVTVIAELFDVSPRTIRHIKNNTTWKGL